MLRVTLAISTVLSICLLTASFAYAQDDEEMSFSIDELAPEDEVDEELPDDLPDDLPGDEGDGGDEEMSFDVVDTEKAATDFEAQRKADISNIRVIQRRPFLRTKRLELAPMLGVNINDSLINIFVASLSMNYYLSEVLGIGVHAAWANGQETELFDKVINDYALFPEVSKVLWSATLDFQYLFVYGKFALFNRWIIPWDMYAVLGAGATQTQLAVRPTLTVGVGQRYFMNKWLALCIEVRDNAYNEDYQSGSETVNNLLFTFGASFFIPPSFEYKMLK